MILSKVSEVSKHFRSINEFSKPNLGAIIVNYYIVIVSDKYVFQVLFITPSVHIDFLNNSTVILKKIENYPKILY